MSPRVTVIIATYNWSAVLPYSIGSVLQQTFTDFELLVVGDGCTDDSEQVVTAIGDPRVRWINIPRFGHQSGPNNEGLRQARGEIIAYLGHDDLWLPHHLALHVAAIDAGADIASSFLAWVGPEGSYLEIMTPDRRSGGFIPPTSVSHRASVTARVGGWRDYREMAALPEVDLWLRAFAAQFRFEVVERVTGVKLPAGPRRNVYRTRPCHEQAAWFARIQSEPDLEAVLFGHVIAHPSRQILSLRRRAWRLIRHPSRWLAYFFPQKGANIRAWQRFKGVDDAGRSTER